MTRRIQLPLGSTTTETHCVDCPMLGNAMEHMCDAFGVYVGSRTEEPRRIEACRAAEVKDEEVGDAK